MKGMLNLEQIKARSEAATPGPWCWVMVDGDDTVLYAEIKGPCDASRPIAVEGADATYRDKIFIAHARTDIPALIAEVERLREERDATVKDLANDNSCRSCGLNENGNRYACEFHERTKTPHDCANWEWRGRQKGAVSHE